MKKQSKKIVHLLKKARITKKKQLGRGGNNNKDKEITPDTLTNFFNITKPNADPEYLKAAIKDALYLYPAVNWMGPLYETYDKVEAAKGKKGEEDEDTYIIKKMYNVEKGNEKNFKPKFFIPHMFEENDFNENLKEYLKDITNSDFNTVEKLTPYVDEKSNYMLAGLFKYDITAENEVKCVAFYNKNTTNIIFLFKCETKLDLYNGVNKYIIDALFNFIDDVIERHGYEKILLFGFYMGGNIAQHIALRFINEYLDANAKIESSALSLVSLGISEPLAAEDTDKIEKKLGSNYVSIGLISNNKSIPTHSEKQLLSINKNTKGNTHSTLKTLLLNVNLLDDTQQYVLNSVEPYDGLKKEDTMNNEVYDYELYRIFLGMAIDGKSKQPFDDKPLSISNSDNTKTNNFANVKSISNSGDDTEPTTFNDLTAFFNIKDAEYFKDALSDAIGLYSLLDWVGPTYNTYNNKNNNFKSVDNNSLEGKKKPNFKKETVHNPFGSKNEYMLKGIFYKKVDELSMKCIIFKKNDTNQYIAIFIWGMRPNLHDPIFKKVLDKMYEYIIEKTKDSTHILLFGFSMGGNIAHHIALRFTLQNPDTNIYFASFGSGGTLYESEKSLLECKLHGKFISISIMMPTDKLTQDSNGYYNYNNLFEQIGKDIRRIDYSIYPTNLYEPNNIYPTQSADSLRTIKTLLISVDYGYDYGNKNSPTTSKYKIFENYDFHKIRDVPFFSYKWVNNPGRPLHNFMFYRKYLNMIIAGKATDTVNGEGNLLL